MISAEILDKTKLLLIQFHVRKKHSKAEADAIPMNEIFCLQCEYLDCWLLCKFKDF